MNAAASVSRLRRSLIYVPGDREAMIAKAAQRGADGLILNLEDAVAPGNKELARNTVAQALAALDFGRAEIIVRINPLDTEIGYRDLLTIAPAKPDAILLPKVGSPEEVRFAAWTIARLEEMHGLPAGGIRLMCMIESASGVLAAAQIAGCHPRVAALLFGAADYSAEVGCAITPDGDPPLGGLPSGGPLLYAQSQIVLASRAAGIDAIDTPYMRLDDPDGLARSSQRAHQLGFDGKSAIHPGQIGPINSIFSPTPEQIAWAERVLAALSGGDEAQLGAAVLDGQLIEAPHLARARRTLRVALQAQIAAR
jgi:citrate lyase subunit beta/citryl-CoA lyase